MSTEATLSSPDAIDEVGLPDDIATLHAMIRELLKTLRSSEQEKDGLRYRLDRVRSAIDRF